MLEGDDLSTVLAVASRPQANLAHGEPAVRYKRFTMRHVDPPDEPYLFILNKVLS
jgi:hypothetical protein